MTLDLPTEVAGIVTRLRVLAPSPVDPAPIIRTAHPFYGAKVGDLRRVARTWRRDHPDALPGEIGRLADRLWGRAVREEMVVAALIHGGDAAARSSFGRSRLEQWIPLLDNWETTDQLGMTLLGPWVGDEPGRRIGELDRLADRASPWARRLALVGAARLARLADAPLWWPAAAGLVLQLADDRQAAIPKAISWVLREHTRSSAAEVAGFIDTHAATLPAIAVREARHKLAAGTKR